MKQAVFFIHGGPGLNSIPEKRILGPLLKASGIEAFFWSEPSALRPAEDSRSLLPPTFKNWVDSAKEAFERFSKNHEKIQLIGHSFGTHGALHISDRYASQIAGLTLISPAIDLHAAQIKVCGLSQEDFRESQPAKSQQIAKHLEASRYSFDTHLDAAFALAFENEKLLQHYWHNSARMQEWFESIASSEAQIDAGSLLAVSRTFDRFHYIEPTNPKDDFPVHLVFGDSDPLVTPPRESTLARVLFKNVRETVINKAAHFPHLEQPSAFLESAFQRILGVL